MAPKGNKNAVGNQGGRPRELDRVQIALDLIEWAKKPDSINLNKFCAYHEPILSASMVINWAKEDVEFKQSYEMAKAFLAFRREEWLNSEKLHVKAYDLNASAYDLITRDEKRSQIEFEAAQRKEQDSQPQQIILKVSNDGLGAGLKLSASPLSNASNKSAK